MIFREAPIITQPKDDIITSVDENQDNILINPSSDVKKSQDSDISEKIDQVLSLNHMIDWLGYRRGETCTLTILCPPGLCIEGAVLSFWKKM